MIMKLIAALRKNLADRRRYARVVAELEMLSARELSDLRADRSQMIRLARAEIFGVVD